MATKRYNNKTFVFTVNGEEIRFYCDTTNTRNGFCHHVFASGGGKYYEHRAIEKFPKSLREPLRLEVEAVALDEHKKAERFIKVFEANFAALSDEQKKFVYDHTPEITNKEQAKTVNAAVAMMAAL